MENKDIKVGIEKEKEEFKKYLEDKGVIAQITSILVSLYEETEKPTEPLE